MEFLFSSGRTSPVLVYLTCSLFALSLMVIVSTQPLFWGSINPATSCLLLRSEMKLARAGPNLHDVCLSFSKDK